MKAIRGVLNSFYYHWRRSNWLIDPRFFLKKSYNVPIVKPIFLLGNQGDGLTLVSRMLRRNHKVVSVTGNYEYWCGADEMQNVFGLVLPEELSGIRYKAPVYPRLPAPRSWSYASDELIARYRKTRDDYDLDISKRLRKVITYVLKRHARNGNCPARFIDKSQVYTVRLSFIDQLLKDTNPKFILITRNPYAACYRAALGKAGDMKRYKKMLSFQERLRLCAQHWKNSMECVLHDCREGVEVLIVKFEEILLEPEKWLSVICEYAELEYNEDMLPQSHHCIPLGVKYADRWYPLKPNINEQYLSTINAEEITIIEKECRNVAVQLGYEVPVCLG